jgi:DNA-binding transcriptional ArsR family regulator
MLEFSKIDTSFRALAEPTRRALVERLSLGPASVSELARPFDTTLAAIAQHLQVLEESGLVKSEKVGRVRTCAIDPQGLEALSDWIFARRRLVERRLDRLGEVLDEMAAAKAADNSPPSASGDES